MRSFGSMEMMSISKSDIMRGEPSGFVRVIVWSIAPSLSVKSIVRGEPSGFVCGFGSKYERL